MTGEAVAVDLGERGVVFAIMDQDGSIFDIENAFDGPKLFSKEGAEYYSQLEVGENRTLRKNDRPKLVTFGDLDDPKTVELVQGAYFDTGQQQAVTVDKFGELFGDGVTVDSVSIEVTEDPVTFGIEKWLPWLPTRKNIKGYLGSDPQPPYIDPSKTYLNGIEFSRGKYWLIDESGD